MTDPTAGRRDSDSTRVKHDPAEHIYTFDRPPVSEVVCGVGFQALPNFSQAEIGRYWASIADEFPTSESVLPLPSPGAPFPFAQMLAPRLLFRTVDETRIIQLQESWFLYNWVRTKGATQYPRYSNVYAAFKHALDGFLRYLQERKIGPFVPTQFRLTYVNHIPKSDGWKSPTQLAKFLPDFFSAWPEHKFVPQPQAFAIQFVTALPNAADGQLEVSIKNAPTRDQPEEMFVCELNVLSVVRPREIATMKEWFDAAREVIVRTFVDLTSPEARALWGLHD